MWDYNSFTHFRSVLCFAGSSTEVSKTIAKLNPHPVWIRYQHLGIKGYRMGINHIDKYFFLILRSGVAAVW